MVSIILPLFRFGIGYALPPGRTYRKNWKERLAWGLVTLGLTSGWVLKPVERGLIRSAPWLLRAGWSGARIVAADTALMARAAAGTQTAAIVANVVLPVTTGYVIGAVAGTVIVSQAEKKEIVYEGATGDVLDFYTGEGHYWDAAPPPGNPTGDPTPGYFNIPGNASLIAKHYWNKWR
jgi:hypothetical protein